MRGKIKTRFRIEEKKKCTRGETELLDKFFKDYYTLFILLIDKERNVRLNERLMKLAELLWLRVG